MVENCPECDRPLARIDVPADLREFAPDGAPIVGCCPRCLRTFAADASEDTDVDGGDSGANADLPPAIPDGDGGVALLLALGRLDSLATNRPAIQSLVEAAEAAGVDVFLALDRLAADESVDAHADLARRRRQLETLLE
ncbi:DUF6276 family protein [Halobellus ordinarius]|uniref:DUF6276 family protein n=1 Tax=Halobellus ordinarius TaxID=3075120 RepID=UPI0028803C91|nr:DUF6276 family protein [Halobellus sp. ZY16]